jgi:hypothetical protein
LLHSTSWISIWARFDEFRPVHVLRNRVGRASVVDDRLKREGKDSPNTKYRTRSALLQERASKLVSGGGKLTTGVEPATIGCEA